MIELGRHSYMGAVHDNYDGQIKIGAFCSIANGVTFLGHCEHPPKDNPLVVSTYNFAERWGGNYPSCSGKPIIIGNDVWIGENVLILDGVTIGDGAIIGAGSVVTKDVLGYSVVCGNPAVKKKLRFDPMDCVALLTMRWWEWSDELIKQRLPDMANIKIFIEKYGRI